MNEDDRHIERSTTEARQAVVVKPMACSA